MSELSDFFFSSRRRQTRCTLVTGVQTCALPICLDLAILFASGGWIGRDAATAASSEDFREEGGEEEAIGVRGLLDERASALRFVVGNRLVAPEPVDHSRGFETRRRRKDANLAEAGSHQYRVKTGEKRSEERRGGKEGGKQD